MLCVLLGATHVASAQEVTLVQQWNNNGILWLLPYVSNGTALSPANWTNTGQNYNSTPSGTPALIALDINGDGNLDVVQEWDNNGVLWLLPYISNATNFSVGSWINTGQGFSSTPDGTPDLLAVDINGDGLTDLVQQWNNGGTLLLLPYISNGTSFTSSNWINTGQGYSSGPSGGPALLALDINGDGKTDLLQQWDNDSVLWLLPYLSNGSSFVPANWINTQQDFATGPNGTPGLLTLDINGDGKTDLVQQWNNNGTLWLLPYISSGSAFAATNWVNTGQGYESGPAGSPGLIALDINGDGNVDLVQQWYESGALSLLPYSSNGTTFSVGNWINTGQGSDSTANATPGLIPLAVTASNQTAFIQQWNNGGTLYILPYFLSGGTVETANWISTGQGYGSGPLFVSPGLLGDDYLNPSGSTLMFQITGQVLAGNAAISGATLTITGSMSAIITTDINGNYWFNVPGGGTYTITASDAGGDTFSPASQSFTDISANQTQSFGLASSPGDSNPDSQPASYSNFLASAFPPGSGPANGNDITGIWTDSASGTWSLQSGSGGTVAGAYSSSNPACGTTISWLVTGSGAGASYMISALNPTPSGACGELNPTLSLAWTLTSALTATASVTLTAPAGYYFASTGTNTEQGGTINLTRPSASSFTLTSPSLVPVPGLTNGAQMLIFSTGDSSIQLTTTSSVPTYGINVAYSSSFQGDPNSSCSNGTHVNLAMANGTGTGSATSSISASPAGCSGILDILGTVGGTPTNYVTVVVPPQILIEMLYGEAHGQAENGDAVSELAIGATVRNRFGDTRYFSGISNYQNAITGGQFQAIQACQSAATCVQNGTAPELSNAALIYGGATTNSMNVANAKCFFSPTAAGWSAIQSDIGHSEITVVPKVAADPGCFPSYNRQFVYKSSVGSNADGRGAPAFIFVQYKNSSDPAVIQIQ